MERSKEKTEQIKFLCLILIIPISWSRYPLRALLIGESLKTVFFHDLYSIYSSPNQSSIHAGYRLKTRLICIFTEDRDPFTIQDLFPGV